MTAFSPRPQEDRRFGLSLALTPLLAEWHWLGWRWQTNDKGKEGAA